MNEIKSGIPCSARLWEQTDADRIQRYQELQLQFRGEKNGVEFGYDPLVNTRPYQYRCMGTYVTGIVDTLNPVNPDEMPRCAVVFPGKYLTSDGRVSTRVSQFSFLTLGLCPNCTVHYRIKDVDVPVLFQWARDIIETRKRVQTWTAPEVRPSSGVDEIQFSEKLERELIANKKRKTKTVSNMNAQLLDDLETCATRVESPATRDPHSVVSAAYDKIMSQTSEFSSDDTSDEQQTSILDLRLRIRNMFRTQEARLTRPPASPTRRKRASPRRRSPHASPNLRGGLVNTTTSSRSGSLRRK
jgi:hypothetical protein